MAWKGLFKTVRAGVSGLTRAGLNVGTTDEQTLADRRRVCAMCSHATRRKKTNMRGLMLLSPLSQCGICKCAIAAKTKLAAERCPIERWPAAPSATATRSPAPREERQWPTTRS